MEFKCILKNSNELLEDDPSLTYGHYLIKDSGLTVGIFNNKKCMIFITLTDLLSHLSLKIIEKNWKYKWVGVGDGSIVFIQNVKEDIILVDNSIKITFNKQKFIRNLIDGVKIFLDECFNINQHLINDYQIVDLINSVNNLENQCEK